MFGFRKPTRRDFYQALERAGRAFVAGVLSLYPAQAILANVDGSANVDVDLAKKAIVVGCFAAVAFLWRWLLPDFGRSLPPAAAADNPPTAAVAAAEAEGVPAPPVDDVPAGDPVDPLDVPQDGV